MFKYLIKYLLIDVILIVINMNNEIIIIGIYYFLFKMTL